MQKSTVRSSPYAVQRSFGDCEDPGPGPQHNHRAGYDRAGANSGTRANRLVKELAGCGIDLQNVLDHFVAGGDAIAECQQQQQSREQRHQAKVTHRRRRREQIILMELMYCVR